MAPDALAAKAKLFDVPIPYAGDVLSEEDLRERWISTTRSEFTARDPRDAYVQRHKPMNYHLRELPYSLDAGAEEARWVTSSAATYTPKNLAAARPSTVTNVNFEGRPMPYARDDVDGNTDPHPALPPPKKRENRFTQGRPVPFALDGENAGRFMSSSAEQYIQRDLKEAAVNQRAMHDSEFNIVTLVPHKQWAGLRYSRAHLE